MMRADALSRLVRIIVEELAAGAEDYHRYLPPEVIALLREAPTAPRARLREIVAQVEARLKDRGFPPGLDGQKRDF